MKYLDEEIKLLVTGFPSHFSKTYVYKVYSGNNLIFAGNTFLSSTDSSMSFDITKILRTYKWIDDLSYTRVTSSTIPVGVIENVYIIVEFDGSTRTSGQQEVAFIYRYPRRHRDMDVDIEGDNSITMIQGSFIDSNGNISMRLIPHYPFIKTDNFSFSQMFKMGENSVTNFNFYGTINGTSKGTGFNTDGRAHAYNSRLNNFLQGVYPSMQPVTEELLGRFASYYSVTGFASVGKEYPEEIAISANVNYITVQLLDSNRDPVKTLFSQRIAGRMTEECTGNISYKYLKIFVRETLTSPDIGTATFLLSSIFKEENATFKFDIMSGIGLKGKILRLSITSRDFIIQDSGELIGTDVVVTPGYSSNYEVEDSGKVIHYGNVDPSEDSMSAYMDYESGSSVHISFPTEPFKKNNFILVAESNDLEDMYTVAGENEDELHYSFAPGRRIAGTYAFTGWGSIGIKESVGIFNMFASVHRYTYTRNYEPIGTRALVRVGGSEICEFDLCPKRFYLKWQDRYGGWQCQGFDGKFIYSEKFSRETITSYDDTRKVINNELTPAFEVNTGWLTDSEYRFYESILVSDLIELYDVENDYSYIVLAVDNSYTEKTFKNQEKLFNMKLKLELNKKQEILS